MVLNIYFGNTYEALIELHKRIPKKLKVVKWPIFWVPLEFLLKMTFRVMNKVMNNFKNLGNSIVIQSMNENVIRFPDQNTLNTNTKQIRNSQKEISGGFF